MSFVDCLQENPKNTLHNVTFNDVEVITIDHMPYPPAIFPLPSLALNDIPVGTGMSYPNPILKDSRVTCGQLSFATGNYLDLDKSQPESNILAYVTGAPNILALGSNAQNIIGNDSDTAILNNSVNPQDIVTANKSGGDTISNGFVVGLQDTTNNNSIITDMNGIYLVDNVDSNTLSLDQNGCNITVNGFGQDTNIINYAQDTNIVSANGNMLLSSNNRMEMSIGGSTGLSGYVLTTDVDNVHCMWMPNLASVSNIQLCAFQNTVVSQTINVGTTALMTINTNSVNGGLGVLWGAGGTTFTAPVGGGVYKFTLNFNASLLDFNAHMQVLLNGAPNPVYGQLMSLSQSNLSFSYLYNLSAGNTISFQIDNSAGFFNVVINQAYLMIELLQPFI